MEIDLGKVRGEDGKSAYQYAVEGGYRDTEVSFYRDLAALEYVENTLNKTTSLSAESTDTQYPSAKAVYDEIQAVKESVSSGKSLVAAAVTDKGVQTAADATFQTMANNIRQIETGTDISDTTATTSDVLSPKVFHDASGSRKVGTIQSKSAATYNVSESNQTINAGFYLSGNQTIRGVTVSNNLISSNIRNGVTIQVGDSDNPGRIRSVTGTYSGTDTSDATLSADEAVSGKYFYGSVGTRVQGTMPDMDTVKFGNSSSMSGTGYTNSANYEAIAEELNSLIASRVIPNGEGMRF